MKQSSKKPRRLLDVMEHYGDNPTYSHFFVIRNKVCAILTTPKGKVRIVVDLTEHGYAYHYTFGSLYKAISAIDPWERKPQDEHPNGLWISLKGWVNGEQCHFRNPNAPGDEPKPAKFVKPFRVGDVIKVGSEEASHVVTSVTVQLNEVGAYYYNYHTDTRLHFKSTGKEKLVLVKKCSEETLKGLIARLLDQA